MKGKVCVIPQFFFRFQAERLLSQNVPGRLIAKSRSRTLIADCSPPPPLLSSPANCVDYFLRTLTHVAFSRLSAVRRRHPAIFHPHARSCGIEIAQERSRDAPRQGVWKPPSFCFIFPSTTRTACYILMNRLIKRVFFNNAHTLSNARPFYFTHLEVKSHQVCARWWWWWCRRRRRKKKSEAAAKATSLKQKTARESKHSDAG